LFATVSALLAVGQVIAVVERAALDPGRSGWAELPLIAAVPVAVTAGLLLRPPRSGRRPEFRVVLDAFVVLIAVAVIAEVVLADVVGATTGLDQGLLTVGYPAVGAVVCGSGVHTVARVEPARRRAATWLLVAFVFLLVVAVAGARARVGGSAVSDLVTVLAWIAMLVAAVLAATADSGRTSEEGLRPAIPVLFGTVLSVSTAYTVVLLMAVGHVLGREMSPLEAVAVTVLILLAFVRSLLWAVDGHRLARRLVRAEAYFRALVNSADDVTVVLDRDGAVSWVSGAARAQLGWSQQELTGRVLADLLHEDERDLVDRVATALAAGTSGVLPATVRLCSRAGSWRDIEVSGGTRAGVPGTGVRDGLVLHLRDVTAHRSDQRELERLAYTDFLTGLPNRARFVADLQAARTRVAAGGPACVLLLDLDGFKTVNDVAGHDAGDRLLQEVARTLSGSARDGDLVARLGGDEFALLVPGTVAEVTPLAERLVGLLDRPFRAPGEGPGPVFAVSGSAGVAEVPADEDAAVAVSRADLALRAAKAAGKNRVRTWAGDLDDAMGRRARLARDLPAAIEDGQLRVHYQPVVGVDQRRVVGLEALVRWEHPLLGTVPPDEFIGLAEEDGLIVPLERWVLARATADSAALHAEGRDLNLGVNISVRHLQAGCLAPDVAVALADSGLPPDKFVVEITESVLLDRDDGLAADLATLREMGCTLALDDFGRGWSSLAYLARLPVSILKMDREFVGDIERDRRTRALVGSVTELGRTLGMDVVAEGVETAGQAAVLQELGCAFLQGYLIGRPVPIEELRGAIDGFDAAVLAGSDPTGDTLDVHSVGRAG
jgi:diguanylate cyclase (GGDEF)-like protein/PAS domain S-box-containing protein